MNKNRTDKIIVSLTKCFGIILFTAIIIWGIVYFLKGYRYEQTDDAQVDAYLSPVNAKVGGYISRIYYKDNQQVNKGDTLVVIEPDEYGLKRDAAFAELMSSHAKLPILAANEETQIKSIDVIKAQLSGAKAKLNQQQREFDRYRNLLADESTTAQKFEIVSAALAITQSDYDQTKASLQVAESRLNDLKAQHSAIEAEIKIKEAILERQELDIKYTVITAPFDGQIGKKTIQEGQLIQPGQTLAFMINKAEEKWVIANFKETQIVNFQIGQAVSIEIDAFPEEKFNGLIESLSPTTGSRYSLLPPDNATGNFVKIIQRIPVRIRLTDMSEKLAKLSAGMNANVYILKRLMMQSHKIPVFKPWVSEWMARSVIFAILMSCLFSFAFYGNPVSAMGYYGIQPADVQFATLVIYGSTVAFLALDFRIVKVFYSKEISADSTCHQCGMFDYLLPLQGLDTFVICQFVQGITCALMSGIVLQLIFPRLESTRARVVGYTLLYGSIQISVPFYSIYSSVVLHFYGFNWLYYGFSVILIIVACAVLLTMHRQARFTKKIPLYQVDWIGYLFYVSFILILGYILIYGRQLGWSDSPFIVFLSIVNFIILMLFVIRETKLKRPLINLQIFKVNNFVIGLLLLFAFYIFKGSTGLTYGYLEVILGNDPLGSIPIWIAVISGTVLSMFVTSRFVLMGYNLIWIIIVGFGFMALYYTYMILFVSVQGETIDFILPMFIYGVATGVLFVPIVSFTTSTVPPKIALNASLVGIFARFTGFSVSLVLSNELQLFTKSSVREKIRETLVETNLQLPVTLLDIQNKYMNAGSDIYMAKGVSAGYLNRLVGQQILARATLDYYDLMLFGVICMIVILLLLPEARNVILRLRKGNIPY